MVMKKKILQLLAAACSLMATTASAQWNTVDPYASAGFSVFCLRAMGSDLYAGGSGVAKWNGTAWTSLGRLAATASGGAGSLGINAMVVYNGQLYAGGDMDSVNGVYVDHTIGVAKYNGTTWEKLGTGVFDLSGVTSLAVYHNELYAGGNYGVNKWDGTSWTSVGTVDGPANVVLAVYHDELYAASSFSHIGTATMTEGKGFAKWNGTTWTALPGFYDTLSVLPGINAAKAADMIVFKDELYVMGSLDYAGTTFVRGVGRWNGTSWNPTNGGMTGNGELSSNAMSIDSNNLYIVGPIQKVNTTNDSVFLSAYWDGTKWNHMFGGNAPYTSFFATENYNGKIYSAYSRLVKWDGITSGVWATDNTAAPSVYPNPANGTFHVTVSPNEPTVLRMMNALGTIVHEEHFTPAEPDHVVNVPVAPPSIYYLQVSTNTATKTTKLVLEQ
jgi:hypothetical protein